MRSMIDRYGAVPQQRLEKPLGAHRAVVVGLVADEHPLGGDVDELVIGDVDRADEPADAAGASHLVWFESGVVDDLGGRRPRSAVFA